MPDKPASVTRRFVGRVVKSTSNQAEQPPETNEEIHASAGAEPPTPELNRDVSEKEGAAADDGRRLAEQLRLAAELARQSAEEIRKASDEQRQVIAELRATLRDYERIKGELEQLVGSGLNPSLQGSGGQKPKE